MRRMLRLTTVWMTLMTCLFLLPAMTRAEEKGTTFGLKPFDTPQKVRFGYFAGSPLGIPLYIADQEGFFKELNIEITYETFTNGPAVMEANSTWDMAGAGTGGIITGMLGYGIKVIGITDYTENLALFVRKDSPLAKDPSNPANWKGTTWLYPMGTTMQAVVQSGLQKVGLTMDDIKSINMDVASALTAFMGGSGDGLSVFDTIAFTADDRGLVRIGDCRTLNFVSPCGLLINDSFLQKNRKLAAYVYTVFYKTWEWCNASEANMAKAANYFLAHSLEEGMACNPSIAKRVMEWYKCPDFAKSIALMTKTSPDAAGLYTKRDLIQAEKDALVPLDFFIAQKKYTPADRERFLDQRLMDASVAIEAQQLMAK